MRITCNVEGCDGEAVIKYVNIEEDLRKKAKFKGMTVWFYGDGFGHINLEETRLEVGPIGGKCPRCREKSK